LARGVPPVLARQWGTMYPSFRPTMMPRGGPMQPPAGPTMQDIEAMMDQMIAGLLEQCKSMFEARVATLENLAEQQQAQLQQLQQLSSLDTRVSQVSGDLSALQLDHSTLRDDSQALCDCLLGAKLFGVTQMHQRRRICGSLSVFRSMMEDQEVMRGMRLLLGGRGVDITQLSMASRAFHGACRTAATRTQTARLIQDLDESLWPKLKDFEPSPLVLDKWEKSVTVHTIIGSFRVEGIVGKTDFLKFSDVYKILPQLGLTLEQFVDKFTSVRRTRSAEDVEQMANEILNRFSAHGVEGKDMIKCTDFYRLLEVIGYSLRRFKSIYNGCDEPEDVSQSSQRLGTYRIRGQIGQGRNSVCYLGEHIGDNVRVAIKWPAPRDELATLKDIHRAAPKGGCLGLPRLLATGDSQGQPYFVTELLGSSLSKVFQSLHSRPSLGRWPILRVIGRLVLRRLEALHSCGYVHCDISPENIVLGRARSDGQDTDPQFALFLVDFEHAQKFPRGRSLGLDCGSAEWSSIRSGDGGERLPEDDLEALGWVLVNGLLGDLPWFPWLTMAYKDWDSRWTRYQVVRQVQRAKVRFLRGGWRVLGCRRSIHVPAELLSFIRGCCPPASGKPDYALLTALLGGSAGFNRQEAEREDLRQFVQLVRPLLYG